MLNNQELKLVLNTLNARRTWLKKSLEGKDLDTETRQSHVDMLKTLDSSIQKLAVQSPDTESPASKRNLLENARVLLADDDEISSNLLLGTLQDMGIKQIDLARDGVDAFDRIKAAKTPYDVILCDWDMPLLTGIEVHQKAKASNTLRGAYFCMVTGISDSQHIREAIGQGVSDYIVKPIDASILEGKLKTALAGKDG